MELFYREKGKGYPLIILHGLWGASENWLPIANRLADRFHVILPDLRNHGHSPHAPEHDYQVLSDDLITFIQHLELPFKPHILGHSMGGKTVMALLLRQPNLIKKAIVVDIAPISYTLSDEHRQIFDYILHTDPATFSGRNELQNSIRNRFPEESIRQLLFKNIRITTGRPVWKINTQALCQHLNDICNWPDKWEKNTYPSPILFIKGSHSEYIPNLSCIRKQFPAALLETIDDSTHRIHTEQPEKLIASIHSFLS